MPGFLAKWTGAVASGGSPSSSPAPTTLASLAELAGEPDESQAERVAIMVHDGGLPVDWAEAFAAYQAMPPPEGLTAPQWLALIDMGLSLGDVHATRLAGLGWAFRDLFRTDGPWPRLDLQGRGWLLAEALAGGGAVVAMNEAAIRYQDRAGACFTIWKPGREPWMKSEG